MSDISQGGQDDHKSHAMGFTYAVGGLTFGYLVSNDAHDDAGGTDAYANTAFGISFNVNDDLSISYGEHKSDRESNGDACVETKL